MTINTGEKQDNQFLFLGSSGQSFIIKCLAFVQFLKIINLYLFME